MLAVSELTDALRSGADEATLSAALSRLLVGRSRTSAAWRAALTRVGALGAQLQGAPVEASAVQLALGMIVALHDAELTRSEAASATPRSQLAAEAR